MYPPSLHSKKRKGDGKGDVETKKKKEETEEEKVMKVCIASFLFLILNWFFLIRSFLLIKCWSKLILYKFVLKNKTSLFPQLSTLAVLIFNETTIVLFIIWSAIFLILCMQRMNFPLVCLVVGKVLLTFACLVRDWFL